MNWRLSLVLAMVWGSAHAAVLVSGEKLQPVMVHGALQQGGFYVGRVPAGSVVKFQDVDVPVNEDGLFAVGFDRAQAKKAVLKVCRESECVKEVLWVKPRKYIVQKITNVPQNTVEPNVAEQARMAEDSKAIVAARQPIAPLEGFTEYFKLPVQAPTSGVFGSSRTYNGQERNWHKGHDLAAPVGTVVKAPAAGVVKLARDTFMNGNLVMLDHGGGITSIYAHLSEMKVKVGDKLQVGDALGKVGTTGRSTGPHLHWGIYWKNIAIDPMLWVKAE